MRYADLISFEPVESVIQLRRSDDLAEAQHLVETFVVSDRMAEVITGVVIPNLRFDRPHDSKGLLIVGNYGSGKSHLMAVLSAVAQWPEMRERVRHSEVVAALEPVAGRFQVLRVEIGATRMPLRDIVLKERLEPFLHRLGIEFTFPDLAEVSNTKDPLLEALAAFRERYPEQGLLVVVDELLDYLRGRREQELVLDLSFLREVGEVCRLGPFRLIAGVQEALFDNPRFQFAADALRRVRDRFEQIRITRQDVAYVVAERVLRKTGEQQARIRQHLQRFTSYYGSMAERLDDFVRLFPIHPAYLEVFERITFAEQRVALKAISQTVRNLLEQDVPADEPGVVSYDAYWPLLVADPAYRASPEIREVIEKSQVLSNRIAQAYTRPAYRPLAERLIAALSVLRLTTGDIYAPIGATPEELRDDLSIFDPNLPERDAAFLRDTVETALREMIRTVSGQFISVNPDNGQYYLDLKKDIDYDAKIGERAEILDADCLNRYFFSALREALGLEEQTYVTGFRIWEYEIPWPEKQVTRPGYLFFGTPLERSTAQPPRDFYLYFLQPFETPAFQDEQRPDEVFFRLTGWDDLLEQDLRVYAAAGELAPESSGVHQRTYREKADLAKRKVIQWLHGHLDRFSVVYQGDIQPLPQRRRLGVGVGPQASFREIVQGVAAGCLSSHFQETYPDYPAFRLLRQPITGASRPKMVEEALRYFAGRRTQAGAAILDGLGLLDGEHIRPEKSPYARYIRDLMAQKGPGQVLNRSDLIEPWMETERMRRFKIEPEFVAVVLIALVYAGEAEVVLQGRKVDAASLAEGVSLPLDELLDFRYIAPPRELPLAAWIATFELLDLAPGLIQNPDTREAAVIELQKRVQERLNSVVKVRERARRGLQAWGAQVLEGPELEKVLAALDGFKAFLDSLSPFDTPGKLRNLSWTVEEVQKQENRQRLMREVEALSDLLAEIEPDTGYLRQAALQLPDGHPLVEQIEHAQREHLDLLRDPQKRTLPQTASLLRQELEHLKQEYKNAYLFLHRRARLDSDQDRRKTALTRSAHLRQLRDLANRIPVLPRKSLKDIEQKLSELVSCWRLIPEDLEHEPICPHCHYRPGESPQADVSNTLAEIESRIDQVRSECVQVLRENLNSPVAQESIAVMSSAEQAQLRPLLEKGELPDPLDESFLRTLTQALGGLERVNLLPEDILMALTAPGMPCTVDELRRRFEDLLRQRLAGKDPERVRLVVDW